MIISAAFKKIVHQWGVQQLQLRIQQSKILMQEAQEAANQEEKSSAGDKYETSRSMQQLAKNMHARQLQSNQEELAALLALEAEQPFTQVFPGALVQTSAGYFYVAAGLGKAMIEGTLVYLIAPAAPLAQAMMGKKINERYQINQQTNTILQIC